MDRGQAGGKAAVGQRAHKLVPDPVTAPVVAGIFDMFIRDEASLRLIAERLTAADIPSPSAHDLARNRHRNPDGWAFGAVRAILSNPTYTGYRVWGKQLKVESLIDPDDVASGTGRSCAGGTEASGCGPMNRRTNRW